MGEKRRGEEKEGGEMEERGEDWWVGLFGIFDLRAMHQDALL